jgi:hypothetical protein
MSLYKLWVMARYGYGALHLSRKILNSRAPNPSYEISHLH